VKERRRTILHVDLDPFFVNVERSLDPSLRGKPVIVGGGDPSTGLVAAASSEARAAGVTPGQALAQAQRLCPTAVVRPGDLETYGHFSEQVTGLLLALSRRVERPSADEGYVDLTPEQPGSPAPVKAVEALREDIHRRLGLDASFGLASSRLAARIASSWAKPRGLLLVLPGYEGSFLARQPLSALQDLPAHLEEGLQRAALATLGDVASADETVLAAAVGPHLVTRLREAAQGLGEDPVAVSAPPTWVQEEATIRDRRTDRTGLEAVLDGLARRAARRLRPHSLRAGTVTVEVRRPVDVQRRTEELKPGVDDEELLGQVVQELAGPLLEPAGTVRQLQVRLARLDPPAVQPPLFPDLFHFARDHAR
jgi:DNA polymerase-4